MLLKEIRLENESLQKSLEVEKSSENRATLLPKRLIVEEKEKEKSQSFLEKSQFSCLEFQTGNWNLPLACKKKLIHFIKKSSEAKSEIYFITGVIDSDPYKGLSIELKQTGLAMYRAKEIVKFLYEYKDSSIKIYYKEEKMMQNGRGFILEKEEKFIQ